MHTTSKLVKLDIEVKWVQKVKKEKRGMV